MLIVEAESAGCKLGWRGSSQILAQVGGPRLVSPPPMHDKNHDYHPKKNEFALGIETKVERLFTVLICILYLSFLATT